MHNAYILEKKFKVKFQEVISNFKFGFRKKKFLSVKVFAMRYEFPLHDHVETFQGKVAQHLYDLYSSRAIAMLCKTSESYFLFEFFLINIYQKVQIQIT